MILLLLVLAAGVLFLGKAEWTGPSLLTSKPTPSAVPTRVVAAAPRSEATITTSPAQQGDVTVEITESEMNARLTQQFAGRPLGQTPLGPATLERAQIMLRSGQATLNGAARVRDASVPFSSALSTVVDGAGGVKVSVTDAKVSGVPMPEPVRAELETSVQREVNRQLAAQRIYVRSVEIRDGRLRATGRPA